MMRRLFSRMDLGPRADRVSFVLAAAVVILWIIAAF